MPPEKELSIIIVNYNQSGLTADCLEAIQQKTDRLDYEIILVDNGSLPGSLDKIKIKFPSVKIIELESNLGFGRANNVGAHQAVGENLIFLNNDTLVGEDALGKMVTFLKNNPQAAAVGARLTGADGTPDLSCGDQPGFRSEFFTALGLDKIWKKNAFFTPYYLNYLKINQPQLVPVISGADLMVRHSVFEQLGGFDENFFFYYEDTDLCLRIKKAGRPIYYLPEAQIIHLRNATIGGFSAEKFIEWRRSRLYFYKKNYAHSEFLKVKRMMFLTLFLRLVFFPVFWVGQWLGLKKNLEKYAVYFKAWELIKKFE